MQEKPMSEIRVYPGTTIGGNGSKVIFTLTPIIGETREEYEHRCQEVFKLAVSFVAPAGPTFEVADTSRYRKVGEHSYEIITPGYEPQEKPVSERDSHFAKFADNLWMELVQSPDWPFPAINMAHYEVVQSLKTIIARRAYDLACHVASGISESMAAQRETDFLTAQECVEMIDDMDKLPE